MIKKISFLCLFLKLAFLGIMVQSLPIPFDDKPPFLPLNDPKAKNCEKLFRVQPLIWEQTDLFKELENRKLLEKIDRMQKGLPLKEAPPSVKSLKPFDLSIEKRNLIQYFQNSSLNRMEALLTYYPQLKNLRWTRKEAPELFEFMDESTYKWCPRGWGLLQLAAYFKKKETLALLLKLDLNIRAKKKSGGISLEDNSLHISLKRNFKEGVDLVLEHQGLERFGKKSVRFIDEKDHQKKTPWFLAIRRDVQHKNTLFTNLIGQYEPSGYVQSYVIGRGAKDGFETARATQNPQIVALSKRYLKVSKKYKDYKILKSLYGHETREPR